MFESESFESYNHTTWAEFKKYINGTYATLAFQYQEKTDYYIIVTEPYAGIAQSFDLIKNSGADQTDFETNFKVLAPRKPGSYQTTQVTGSIAAGNSFSGNPVVISGIDGSSNVRIIKTTSDGSIRIDPIGTTAQPIVGTGTAGTPNSGVVTIQGISGGVAIPVSGSISATNPSVSTTNTTPPTSLTYIGGNVSTSAPTYTNGNASAISITTAGAIRVDNSGVTQPVSGTVTANAGTGNFNVIQSTASSLRSQTASEGTNGSAIPTISSLIGGNDGTNLRPIGALNTNPSGSEYGLVVRNLPSGTQTVSGTVTANAGTGVFDVTPASPVANDYLPVRLTDGSSFYTAGGSGSSVEQTFVACATSVVVGNNKSMLSITNATGSGVVIKIYEIRIVNVQTTAVTGIVGNFELRRIASHSAGTLINTEELDTNNSLNANVTVRAGSTVATESTNLLWRVLYSTDEWGTGTLDVEASDHINQALFSIWNTAQNTQPITLRPNEGLTVKFATNSTAGSFDILVKFTQV